MDFGAWKQNHLHLRGERSILRVWKRFHTLFNALYKTVGTLHRRRINLGTRRCLFFISAGDTYFN